MNSYQAGQKLLCGGYTAYTPEGKAYFVRAGRYYKDPLPGDWVYYYSAKKQRVAHVGVAVKVENLPFGRIRMTAAEGNPPRASIFLATAGALR